MSKNKLDASLYGPLVNVDRIINSYDDKQMEDFITFANYQSNRIDETLKSVDKSLKKLKDFARELKDVKEFVKEEKERVQKVYDTIESSSTFLEPVVIIKHVDRYVDNYRISDNRFDGSRKKVQVSVQVVEKEMRTVKFKDGHSVVIRGDSRNDVVDRSFLRDWEDRKEVTEKAKEWAKELNCEIERVKENEV